ncbi:NEW3 domain-containing protein [Mycolicibacter hiberniae]|uniref:Alpha-mannosidase n=1 Tax=Mycolicibacter hiberniae TaxID=29314 RepID=A0A7I7WYQ5_9MYCO|nr:NEW3 domain-containing protein [Mycolicibacter hiberniae]MCV7086933.1 alpha-mannosidase [Mycolicibacter hiberniae]ORV70830.1 alpha-mannosidase [Mycolicibacter hiberniae]BBZ21767.1 alpha-mannosidase [Mycolicibacter hiberniae]
MRILDVESTEKFVGPADAPAQLVRVDYRDADVATPLRIDGAGLAGEAVAEPGSGVVEVPVTVADPTPGQQRAARANGIDFTFTVAEPGWTLFMVGHFHYDPVWWNTQANYTSVWTEHPLGACRQSNGFDLVRAHLDWARDHPEYKFVMAEVDYLKPYWDTHPQDRAELRRLLAQGRVEVMGGTYNEPSTNLTDAETTIRNLVAGMGFQRDVMGADPVTAWQLDVFGHDPQFPGLAADAGLSSSAWARGPFHQWGPMAERGDPRRMQFPSEFEWIAPSGRGLLTHYMPAHYAAGWWMDASASLAAAQDDVYRLFVDMKKVAATRNVLLPVGTDFTPPNRWITQIHRDWNARYTWPRFICALPREFFAAVRAELRQRGAQPSPQTRDMNPIYTGCHVSYIDTKQANRAAERATLGAERFAVFAAALTGAPYPDAALAKAWAQLCYGAHHDAITGSEADQVYLDLLTGWRDAWQLGTDARDNALTALSGLVETGHDGQHVVVWNPVARDRTDVVTVHLASPLAAGARVIDSDGIEHAAHVDHGGSTLSWLAVDVPSLGWRSSRVIPTPDARGWQPVAGAEISNEHHRLVADPARGGGIASWRHRGREMIVDGGWGNQLAVYDEYPRHPQSGEGPWHLVPSGNLFTSAVATAVTVQAQHGPLGQRLVVSGQIRDVLTYTQTLTLWHGVDRVDCATTVHEFTGADHLLRLRWPCPIPGAMPVAEVADAVIGRGFAVLHEPSGRSVDTAQYPRTLDTSAHRWFGLSATVRINAGGGSRAVSVAEVVRPAGLASPRELMVALVRRGVTATCSQAEGPRYGDLGVDSNLPDVRIALGGPDRNGFTRAVLADADPAYTAELRSQLERHGRARVWVPAQTPLARAWVPGADLTGPRALPVLMLAARDDDGLAAEISRLADDLADAQIEVEQDVSAQMEPFEARTVALINRGVPSFAVDTAGTLHTALLRSCTSWPSASWTDGPRRAAPDGSAFQLQHWTHTFDYALVAGDGDWRDAQIPERSAQFADPLRAVPAAEGGGPLPASGSLLRLGDGVGLGALKAAGNPLARGSAAPVDPSTVTLRLVETHGAGAAVSAHSDVGTLTVLGRADLLEQPLEQPVPDRLHGCEIATLTARLRVEGSGAGRAATGLAPETEAAQPLYARYWLHNRGPAPLGGLPAIPAVHPHRVDAEPGTQHTLELTVASDCVDSTLTGVVTWQCPPGWAVTPDEHRVRLAAGEHLRVPVSVRVPAAAGPGLYPLRARLDLSGDLPRAWSQPVEDVAVVRVADPGADRLLYVENLEELAVTAGRSGRLTVTVGTDAHADLAIEAHLISPWGTWEWAGPPAVGAVVPAGGCVELGFDIAPPAWTQPGAWWALVRVAGAGALAYSNAVPIAVLAPSRVTVD